MKQELTQEEAKKWIKERWNTLSKEQLTAALTQYWSKYGHKSEYDVAKSIFSS